MYKKTIYAVGLLVIALVVTWVQTGSINNNFRIIPYIMIPLIAIDLAILFAREGTTIALTALIAIALSMFSTSTPWAYALCLPLLAGSVMSMYQKLWNEPTFFAAASVSLVSAIMFGAIVVFMLYSDAKSLYLFAQPKQMVAEMVFFVAAHVGVVAGVRTIYKLVAVRV